MPSLQLRSSEQAGATADRVALSEHDEAFAYPALAPNVELIGELQGSGFQKRQWLIQRDGRFLQISELLYRVAEQADGSRTLAEIANAVTQSVGRLLTTETVRQIIAAKLVPLGLVAPTSGSIVPAKDQPPSSLAVNIHTKVVGPNTIDPAARVLQLFYAPAVLVPILLFVGLAHEWLYLGHGIGRSIASVLYAPVLLLAVFGILILGNLVHELGHASALRYGGGRAREMGVGLYLVYPAFYTDTTDSYRLGRWARVRTDLGGFYFHLIFATAIMGLSVLLRQEWLLVVAVLTDLDILYQLLPFVRFDGYWAFADLTGIPDLFSQMRPFVRSFLPGRVWRGHRLPALKTWVKVAFAFYIVVTIPILLLLGTLMITHLPQLATTAWASFRLQEGLLALAWRQGDAARLALAAIQMLLLVLQAVGVVYVLVAFARKGVRSVWEWSRPTVLRRVSVAALLATVVILLIVVWTQRVVV